MKNRNGYTDSIMVENEGVCALCGCRNQKLDRHEPWGGANRQKSKELGLWVPLCHLGCHEGPGSVHGDPDLNREFRKRAQLAAMSKYGWTIQDWISRFGKNEIDDVDRFQRVAYAYIGVALAAAGRARREYAFESV